MKLMTIFNSLTESKIKQFSYKWKCTLPSGEEKEGITTLVGPALEDALELHGVSNPHRLIDIWNTSAESTFKTSGYRYRYIKI